MKKTLRIAGSLWRAVLAVGALLGILYLPQDIGDLPVALQRWGPIVSLLTREVALLAFSVVCAAWVVWIDIRPYAKQQWATRFRKDIPQDGVTANNTPRTAAEAEALERAQFLEFRRTLELTALGANGTPVTAEFHDHEAAKHIPLKHGEKTYSIRMSKAGSTAVWVYEDAFSTRQLFHIRYAQRGELLDVRTMRPVKKNAHVTIGERIIFSTPDDHLVQIIITGVLYYESGDEKDEVRFKYQVYEPSDFLMAAL